MINNVKKILIFLFMQNFLDATVPWSEEKHQILVEEAAEHWSNESKKYKIFKYPLTNIEDFFTPSESDKVKIFIYGSLLNKESASKTLSPEAMATQKPALAYGLMRLFNRHMPTSKRWGPLKRDNDTAMLNLNRLDDFSKVVNGAVITVGKRDLENLIAREVGYDLVPVVVNGWDENIKNGSPNFSIAYTFLASDRPRRGNVYTRPDINPVPGYANASMEGAAQYGDTFLSLWLSSTYLSDRKTPFSEWLINPEINCVFDDGCHKD